MPTKAIILNTPGGSVETAEKIVDIIRFHYSQVYFIVPDYAMSAGTILCMSGNKVFMDYASTLGPIDPQILIGNDYFPALGYLDKVDKMLKKSTKGTLTPAELVMLRDLDLGLLRSYEQAKKLTVNLLQQWLVKYKFSDWTHHRTDPALKGQPVTNGQKEERARQIANDLGSNKKRHSHGRYIGVNKLKELRIEVDDYSSDIAQRDLIRNNNDVIVDYLGKGENPFFWHTRKS